MEETGFQFDLACRGFAVIMKFVLLFELPYRG